MRRNLRATLGVLSLLVTTVAGGLALGAVVAPSAGATTTTPHMGTTSGGVVAPVNGTTHTDFPDPAVVSSGTANTYYAYSTGTASALGTVPASWTGGGIGVTMIGCTTSSCTDETTRTVALSITNAPASITRFWGLEAPSVVYLGGQWVMYYGGVYTAGNQIYGVYDATSSGPTSGFGPTSATPLMYQAGTGGSSDPSAFIRPTGQPWLLWKSATWKKAPRAKLWSMQLTTDGTKMKSGASQYVLADQPAGGWTGTTTVENPQMVWSGGTYYLFYSGGHWTRTTYGEGYMTCSGPTGDLGATCGTPNTHEILSSATNAEGPGGGSLFTTATGAWLMAFHGWTGTCSVGPTTSYYKCGDARQLYVRPVDGLYSTSLPSVSTFKASATTVSSAGGTVTLTARATRAVSYKFTANQTVGELPATIHTTTGSAAVTVHMPVNDTTSPVTYTFTVTATSPYGGQVSKQLQVVVAADPPLTAFDDGNNLLETCAIGSNGAATGCSQGSTGFASGAQPVITSTGSGTAMAAYKNGNGLLETCAIGSNGAATGCSQGSTGFASGAQPVITSTGSGTAMAAFDDGNNLLETCAIGSNGAETGCSQGAYGFTSGAQPVITSTGSGTAMVAYENGSNLLETCAIGSNGTATGCSQGSTGFASGAQPVMVSTAPGTAMVAYKNGNGLLETCAIGSNGTATGCSQGSTGFASGAQPVMVSTGSGTAMAAFDDGNNLLETCAIGSNGAETGCSQGAYGFASGAQPVMVSTGSGTAMAAFDDGNNLLETCAIGSNGAETGCSQGAYGFASGAQPVITSTGSGTAMAAFDDGNNLLETCAIGSNGAETGCSQGAYGFASGAQPVMVSTGSGTAMVAYENGSNLLETCAIGSNGAATGCSQGSTGFASGNKTVLMVSAV